MGDYCAQVHQPCCSCWPLGNIEPTHFQHALHPPTLDYSHFTMSAPKCQEDTPDSESARQCFLGNLPLALLHLVGSASAVRAFLSRAMRLREACVRTHVCTSACAYVRVWFQSITLLELHIPWDTTQISSYITKPHSK